MALLATSGVAGVGAANAASTPFPLPLKEGGTMTVLLVGSQEGSWPQGLDPGVDGNGGSNQDLESAIFGNLFEIGPNGTTVPDLATGYKVLNGGKTYDISIRRGVKFSDGTPFNAAAVVDNWKRDFKLDTANTPNWPNPTFATVGPYTAQVTLSEPYTPLINSMHTRNVNYIASPTALAKQGAKQFTITPVGAGPFTVVTDTLSSSLVLKKNPTYWQKGLPYLDGLTFTASSSDESALEAMETGAAQMYKDMSTPKLVSQFQSKFTVTSEQSDSPYDIQLNTKKAPFNNILAREAIYYATDPQSIDEKLYDNTTPVVQGFTGPGGLFYEPKVPGYRTFDLAKAKAIVKQLGGLNFGLIGSQTAIGESTAEALQEQWQAAGMKVTLTFVDTPTDVADFDSGNWQGAMAADGSFDPATGVAQMFRFLSTSPFSGVHDPKLDALLNEAEEVPAAQRGAVYAKVAEYESQAAYNPTLFPTPVWNVADKDTYAPGMTTVFPAIEIVPEVWWQDAGYRK
jgi:peptide/nickel transport system substrate-binding protein